MDRIARLAPRRIRRRGIVVALGGAALSAAVLAAGCQAPARTPDPRVRPSGTVTLLPPASATPIAPESPEG